MESTLVQRLNNFSSANLKKHNLLLDEEYYLLYPHVESLLMDYAKIHKNFSCDINVRDIYWKNEKLSSSFIKSIGKRPTNGDLDYLTERLITDLHNQGLGVSKTNLPYGLQISWDTMKIHY